ncbi:MAG: 30S ribosomal protein S6--L-glutamate ligase [Gammaproteobacteria bacterium CG_4_10_14_0_8_um_filter_38_16]|nr:MAG: 30S ribosomal protein S6--L-glutamate ligase [Gammaproteobacteria bacterium CG_4_10_14_0_8_um_filter_38_16]PJA03201.1 MAG: 30S ribosomal protein S6--L-glutamate ligase [Gammaproteobacteria bacterium CG_4_10_14_0_2_um_filter_38_22]PJB10320.1 MAG: 30S ribosomal protein S6--L-glutamate ligase [Gammaproteobacteria bacterium CG_4_9_14_3_um_filter_38_9]PJC38485.1 MAG: 30S ribosomal protein S6--L-glutamate ligase [Candidatus Peregrinibacteria bacterium CG_4_9_14_0_2_um_filter_38_9]
MKIAILSRNKGLYSTRRLVQAAKERGHEVQVIDYLRCYMNITAAQPAIQYKGQILEAVDAIIPRIGANRTFYGTAILRQFETMGKYSINSSLAITRSRDKLRSQQLLVMKGVQMPATGYAHGANDINDLIDLVGGPPLIIKLIEGTQGVGVVLAETRKAAESVAQTLRGLHANIILQEYIPESKGADIRCFVVGDRVVASMQRVAAPGEFRANLHRGGTAEMTRITKAEREAAIKAAKIMGLGMAGVDFIRSKRGPLILEINSSPGLEGIEMATKKDIAGIIIRHIEKNAKPIGPRSRYQG